MSTSCINELQNCKEENLIIISVLAGCFKINHIFQKQCMPPTCYHSQFWRWLSVWVLSAHLLAKSRTEAVTATPWGHTSWTAPAGTAPSYLSKIEKKTVGFKLDIEVKHWSWQFKDVPYLMLSNCGSKN